jgi:hypothetical protein
MKSTLGEPSFARSGRGQAGLDSPMVRPMRPGKAVPALYSTIALFALLLFFVAFAIQFSFSNAHKTKPAEGSSKSIALPACPGWLIESRLNQTETERILHHGK